MTIKSRVKEFLISINLKKLEFYKLVNVSNGYLDKEGAINSDVLANILTKFPNLNFNWLLFGKGSMLMESQKTPVETCDEKCTLKDYVIELQKEKIDELETKIKAIHNNSYQSQ